MSKVWFNKALRAAVLVAAGLALVGKAAGAEPRPAAKRRAFNLFSGVLGRMNVNRFDCGLDAFGKVCVDPQGSSTVGGGYWPKGTPDQYVFNSGLQLAGIIDPAATGFAWRSDTVGAFFFDPKGTTEHGARLSLVWNSLDPSDNANWPRDAYVPNDPTLFDPLLIGRKAASQQDTWIQYWDGDPTFNAGRKHPLGVLVTQRGMAWNFPTGNEDVIYYLYSFTNISASDPAAYAGLPNTDSLANLGARFQQINEAAFRVTIPDAGYTITNMYAAFAMDADVSDAARENYSTAFIPFNMGMAFKSNWHAPEMLFPGTIFGAPFVAAPGIVGVKYLRSPIVAGVEVGLTMFSNTINGGQFDDAQNATQLWRYLAARLNPSAGDAPCGAPLPPNVGKVCFVSAAADDVRFFQSSGPFSLAPGETKTIVVAYIAAAPVGVPAIANRGQNFDLKPGYPAQASALATAADTLRSVDRVFGAVSILPDANGNGRTDQTEVQTVPRSLLNKGLVAQAVFDGKFLLPFPPDAPEFFLVPGDDQVTVAWQRSPTEVAGDPYYAIASQPTVPDPANPLGPRIRNELYDPNYRRFDVEGYRIYRGRTTGALELVAQFDYAGRQMRDFTWLPSPGLPLAGAAFDYGNCAPEKGVMTDCPAGLATTGVAHDLVGNVIQIPVGGREELANPPGQILVLQADTAVTGGASGYPVLNDLGVPFAFVDRGVKNSFRYYYAVTAFDVNSVYSVGAGSTALESPRGTKEVTPRKAGPNVTQASLVQGVFGDAGPALNTAAAFPTIDPATGTFNGNIPPANGAELLLTSAVLEALPPGDITVRIDRVSAGLTGGIGAASTLHLSLIAGGQTRLKAIPLPQPQFPDSAHRTQSYTFDEELVPYDSARARLLGLRFTQDVRMPVTFSGRVSPIAATSGAVSVTSGRFGVISTASLYLAHSRWFDFGGAEPPDPTIMGVADTSHHAGKLTGVGRIWSPQAYRDPGVSLLFRRMAYTQTAWYPADFVVTWNADSSLTVRDSTHRTTLPFGPDGGSGWGFVNLRAFTAAGVTTAQLQDGAGAPNVTAALAYQHLYATKSLCFPGAQNITCIQLESKAQYEPLDFNSNGVADASGIALMINGEPFIMEMNQIPAAGTRWRLRAVTGTFGASCTPGFDAVMTDCSGYTIAPHALRPAFAPGLSYTITVGQQYKVDSLVGGDLSRVHTVPDPYYVTSAFEQSPNSKILRFVNLPSRCIIRIYSQSGILVNAITLNDQTGGGELTWNLRNRNNQFVASGVYFYHLEAPDGQTKVGRFTVVNFAQ